jgi:hypothetical protein
VVCLIAAISLAAHRRRRLLSEDGHTGVRMRLALLSQHSTASHYI